MWFIIRFFRQIREIVYSIIRFIQENPVRKINKMVEELRRLRSNGQEVSEVKQAVNNTIAKHRKLPLLRVAVQTKVPVWLYGDSGSGKSTAARQVAEECGLDFRFISVCPTTSKSDLLGYNDAAGNYHPTAFREIYENGGVFLIDEIDNGNPSVLAVLNAALSNEHCAFPDGNVARHEDTRIIAAANTIGRGASFEYVGRNALDITTLDRFVYIRMDIDENLEAALTGGDYDPDEAVDISAGGAVDTAQWRSFVQSVRDACHELGVNHLVSPRACIYGHRLIQAGVGCRHLERMCVWKGISPEEKEKINDLAQTNTA
ncbi:MAG: hypothetical protein BRC24_02135 [Parcubacteria group bacterium SW_4_46_8]|nr:MAG: hypothetical protein BRC24_02135 [Parcubacteria group bacterium SW_4_46_8]